MERICKIIWALILANYLFLGYGNGDLTEKPVSTEAVVGQRVQLNCSTSESFYVLWEHHRIGQRTSEYVFFSGMLIQPYNDRFLIETGSGRYNIIIQSVTKEDAGLYRCLAKVGHGEQAEAELIVLDSAPRCEALDVVLCDGKRDFNISCSIGFTGNMPPMMSCSGPDIKASSVTTDQRSKEISYNIHMTAEWSSHITYPTSVECHTTMSNISSTQRSNVVYIKSSSETLHAKQKDVVNCANLSIKQCSYTWMHVESGYVTEHMTLVPYEPGQYKCTAECQNCRITLLTVDVSNQREATEESSDTTIIILTAMCVTLVVVLVPLGLLLLLILKRLRRKTTGAIDTGNVIVTDGAYSNGSSRNEQIKLLKQNHSSSCSSVVWQPTY